MTSQRKCAIHFLTEFETYTAMAVGTICRFEVACGDYRKEKRLC